MFKKFLFLLALSFLLTQESAAQFNKKGSPGLLITPTRAVIEGKHRSLALSLVNNGTISGRYKMSVLNKAMKEDGSIVEINEENAHEFPDEKTAGKMIRISPRRVSLQPGEYQNIRVLARKPKDLPDGEYRSHLRFSIIPDATLSEREEQNKDKENADDDTLSISIKANFGIVIPVIIRHGEIISTGDISISSISKNEEGEPIINFAINRQGNASLYGDISIIHTSLKGKETILKNLGGIAIYNPLKRRIFKLPLDAPSGLNIKKGSIEVIYTKKQKEGGETIAQQSVKL